MSRQRDLGPILAIGATAIAVIAIAAGFIVVGGPGNARDRRLDDMTSQRIGQIVSVVQCAFEVTGIAPIDYPSAAKTRSVVTGPGQPPMMCDGGAGMEIRIVAGEKPAAPGDITYRETGPTQVTICGNFHAKSDTVNITEIYPFSDVYPALAEPHPAGAHCYVLDLVKSSNQFGPWPTEPPPAEPPPKPVP